MTQKQVDLEDQELKKPSSLNSIIKSGKHHVPGQARSRKRGKFSRSSADVSMQLIGIDEAKTHREAFLACIGKLQMVYKMRIFFALITTCGASLMTLIAMLLLSKKSCTEQWSAWSQCNDTSGMTTRRQCSIAEEVACECPTKCSDLIKTTSTARLPRINCVDATMNKTTNVYYVNSQVVLSVDSTEWVATMRC